jgi:hypothetical protein
MKNFTLRINIFSYFLIIFMLMSPILLRGQVYNGDLSLNTQAQVDAFNYTEVTGYVSINGLGISNLDGLLGLDSIGNYLTISGTSIANIDGLSLLRHVGNLFISSNQSLTNINALSGFSSMSGDLTVRNCSLLTNLSGLANITTIGGNFGLDNLPVTNLNALSSLTSVGGRMEIAVNPNLTNLDGLSNLTEVLGGFVNISSNPSLQNINGLSGLVRVGGQLIINANDLITNLNGLSSVSTSAGLSVGFNDALNNYCGLYNLATRGTIFPYTVRNNLTNPTQADILSAGACANCQLPIARCKNTTVNLDGSGNASISAAELDNGSTTPCGLLGFAASPPSFTCDDIGINVVTLTVTDGNGNVSNCNATVAVQDNEAPDVSDCGGSVDFDLPSQDPFTLSSSDIMALASGTFDNCEIVSYAIQGGTPTYNCDDVGVSFPVTLIVSDLSGNSSTCDATINIVDADQSCNQPPIAVCQSVTVDADANCQGSADASDFDGGSTDPDMDALSFSVEPAGPYPLGVTNVILTVTDPDRLSDTCWTTITVEDNTAPVISGCPGNIGPVSMGSGQCGAIVSWTAPTASDNCSLFSFSQIGGLPNGSLFPEGLNTISYLATDAAGNNTPCSFTIEVLPDAEPPFISGCPGNIGPREMDPGQCGATVFWTEPTVSDNCPGVSLAQTGGLESGSSFPAGVSTILYTATDAKGNTTPCVFTISVEDREPPEFTDFPSDITFCADEIEAIEFPSATDNCDEPPSVTCTRSDGAEFSDPFLVGDVTVSCTAMDAAGNSTMDEFVVTVFDAVHVDLGTTCEAVYPAYPPAACIDLVPTVSGGTPPFSYTWTNNVDVGFLETSASITVCPGENTTYTVEVTDANGCTSLDKVEVQSVDISCKNDKVIICHIANERNLCVNVIAVEDHLNHGDKLGPCGLIPCSGSDRAANTDLSGQIMPNTIQEEGEFVLYPNPAKTEIIVQFNGLTTDVLDLAIYDINGKVVHSEQYFGVQGLTQLTLGVSQLPEGMYIVQLNNAEVRYQQKFIKSNR